MVRRKIIVVDSCRECPYFYDVDGHCSKLDVGQFDPEPKVPDYVLKNKGIWRECPLDDAGGFL